MIPRRSIGPGENVVGKRRPLQDGKAGVGSDMPPSMARAIVHTYPLPVRQDDMGVLRGGYQCLLRHEMSSVAPDKCGQTVAGNASHFHDGFNRPPDTTNLQRLLTFPGSQIVQRSPMSSGRSRSRTGGSNVASHLAHNEIESSADSCFPPIDLDALGSSPKIERIHNRARWSRAPCNRSRQGTTCTVRP